MAQQAMGKRNGRRTRAQWLQVVKGLAASGSSISQYCGKQGISEASLSLAIVAGGSPGKPDAQEAERPGSGGTHRGLR